MTKTVKVETPARRKMSPEELQQFLHFKKRGFSVPSKKGKGSYNRKEAKKISAD